MECSLFPPTPSGCCDGCGKKLFGRRTRWCSKGCADLWWVNHDWSQARERALKRDGYRCKKCGATNAPPVEEVKAIDPKDFKAQDSLAHRYRLEVNHIVPLVGSGYAKSCAHHLGGLEILCHRCHLEVTKSQAAERKRVKNGRK